jgi:hypothetical protein
MAFRFNFTGRKRVLEAEAKVHVVKDAKPLKVRLEQTFSGKNVYSPGDFVMLEAIRRTKLRRCALGTVGDLQQETIVDFPDFPDGKEVYYRLRIFDPATHVLKGLAKTLKDADKEQKPTDMEPLLPVALSQPDDEIGNRFWKVRLNQNSDPVLIISSKKFNSYEPVKSAEFKALVLPEVLRQVLTYAFIHSAPTGGFPEWSEKWRTFVGVNLGVRGGPESVPDKVEEAFVTETSQWIDDAVRAFADHFNLSAVAIKNLTNSEDGNE